VPTEYFGFWPAGLPVQIHGMDADPIFVDEGDIDAARELVASTDRGELFLYPGDQHYFADSSLPSYDAEATALLSRRVLDFLRGSATSAGRARARVSTLPNEARVSSSFAGRLRDESAAQDQTRSRE
jgi:hypothetical protein